MDKYEILETIKHKMELSEDNNTFVVWLEEFIKEQEDENIRLEIRNFIWGYPDKLPERDKWLAWFEKQDKKLDADKVIEWLRTHGNLVPTVTIRIYEVIAKFKKDFGL